MLFFNSGTLLNHFHSAEGSEVLGYLVHVVQSFLSGFASNVGVNDFDFLFLVFGVRLLVSYLLLFSVRLILAAASNSLIIYELSFFNIKILFLCLANCCFNCFLLLVVVS